MSVVKLKPTSVRLEPTLDKQLLVLANHIHRSKGWLIQEAVKYYLKERADLEVAFEKYNDPNTEYLDWENVKNDLRHKD